jgi:hypothetical protein
VPRTLSDCVSFPGVIYKAIAGKPIVSEVAMAFRRHERAPAVRAFISYTKEIKRTMGKAEGKETTAAQPNYLSAGQQSCNQPHRYFQQPTGQVTGAGSNKASPLCSFQRSIGEHGAFREAAVVDGDRHIVPRMHTNVERRLFHFNRTLR